MRDTPLESDWKTFRSRSKMSWHLSLMYRHGLIEDSDLDEFSDELREWLQF